MMGLGVQMWDAAGNLLLDNFTRVGRVIGVVSGNTSGGSFNVPSLAQGRPGVLPVLGQMTLANVGPQVSISGTTISYTASSYPFLIVYGTY